MLGPQICRKCERTYTWHNPSEAASLGHGGAWWCDGCGADNSTEHLLELPNAEYEKYLKIPPRRKLPWQKDPE